MDSLLSHDLFTALGVGEDLAALPSRENAKAFCKFAAESMRKLFLVQQGIDLPAGVTDKERDWAAGARKTFPRSALGCLDRASRLIERNVNLKIVFTDLVDKLNGLI